MDIPFEQSPPQPQQKPTSSGSTHPYTIQEYKQKDVFTASIVDSLIDIEKKRQQIKQKQAAKTIPQKRQSLLNIYFDPSEPFKVRTQKEKERKEQKQLLTTKLERLKEALHQKNKSYGDQQEAQRQFQEAYEQIYSHSNTKLIDELKKIEEYFHQQPDNFNRMDVLEKVDEYMKKKERLDKIANEEKIIKELSTKDSEVKDLITKYHIKVMKEQNLSNLDRVMIRCYEDYTTFNRYKEGRFFDEVLKGDAEKLHRKNVIKKIQQELEESIKRQMMDNKKKKEQQIVNNFWENLRLKKMLHMEGEESQSISKETTLRTEQSKLFRIKQKRGSVQTKLQDQGIFSSLSMLNYKNDDIKSMEQSLKAHQIYTGQFDNTSHMPYTLQPFQNYAAFNNSVGRQNKVGLDYILQQKRHSSQEEYTPFSSQNQFNSNQKYLPPQTSSIIGGQKTIQELDEEQHYQLYQGLNFQQQRAYSNAPSPMNSQKYNNLNLKDLNQPSIQSNTQSKQNTGRVKFTKVNDVSKQSYDKDAQYTPKINDLAILKNLSVNSWRDMSESKGQKQSPLQKIKKDVTNRILNRSTANSPRKQYNEEKRYNVSFLDPTPSLHDSLYRTQIGSYMSQQHHEKMIKEQSLVNKQKLKNVIQACYFLENDHLPQNQIDPTKHDHKNVGIQLNKKIQMKMFLEELRNETFHKTFDILKDFETTDEAANIKMLYFYRNQANEDYQGLAKEITKEYKAGSTDPSREVGRIEKSRSAVKKLINNLRLKSHK